MKNTMQLNCDLGEKVHDNDGLIMPYIDMANIACGFHASDPLTIRNTIKLALTNNVRIGAHPSYNDRENFGRESIRYSQPELIAIIQYQLGAISALCHQQNTVLQYVKPHGALYNDMMKNTDIFESVCIAISSFNPLLPLLMQAIPNTQPFEEIAKKHSVALLFEAFADREYTDDGLLVSRHEKNAVIHNTDKIIDRCKMLLATNQFISVSGKTLTLKVDTLCVHGDNPEAIEITKKLRALINSHV